MAQSGENYTDVENLKRVPPMMPNEAEVSGYCCVMFDVTATGKTTNITTPYCTSAALSKAAKTSVGQWTYRPARKNGQPVYRKNMDTNITFHLADVDGRLIPSPQGYLAPREVYETIPPQPNLQTIEGVEAYSKWLSKYFYAEKPCGEFIS